MKFPIGSYVATNPKREIIVKCGLQKLAGKVIEYDTFLKEYTVELDAQSLNDYEENEIRIKTINYEIIDEFEFAEADLIPSQRRDTDEEYAAAKARIAAIEKELADKGLIDISDVDIDDPDFDFDNPPPMDTPERTNKIILYDFERSDYLADELGLSKAEREPYVSDAEMMLEVATHVFGFRDPADWTPDFIEEFALRHLPKKVIASPAAFEALGKSLVAFTDWLWQAEYTDCGRLLYKTMRDAAPKMVKAAGDKSNFSIGKSLLSGALDRGVDLSDEGQIGDFISRFNSQSFEEREAQTGGPGAFREAKIIGLDPFRNLGRNDRIIVRNTQTGEVQENVKFKNVEKELRSGELELVEKK